MLGLAVQAYQMVSQTLRSRQRAQSSSLSLILQLRHRNCEAESWTTIYLLWSAAHSQPRRSFMLGYKCRRHVHLKFQKPHPLSKVRLLQTTTHGLKAHMPHQATDRASEKDNNRWNFRPLDPNRPTPTNSPTPRKLERGQPSYKQLLAV